MLDAGEDDAGGVSDGVDVGRGLLGGGGGVRDADIHVIVALGEIGRRVADATAAGGKGGHHLLDRAAKTLGEKAAAGEMQARLGLAAALIDRKRVGLDHRFAQRMDGESEIRERPGGLSRQNSVAVAAGDLARGQAEHADTAVDGEGCENTRDAGNEEGGERAA